MPHSEPYSRPNVTFPEIRLPAVPLHVGPLHGATRRPGPEPVDPAALLDAVRNMTGDQRRELSGLLADADADSFLILPARKARLPVF